MIENQTSLNFALYLLVFFVRNDLLAVFGVSTCLMSRKTYNNLVKYIILCIFFFRYAPSVEHGKDSRLRETQHKLLHRALEFVQDYGWGPKAFSEAAKALDLSPAIAGSFEYQDAALVYYFLDLSMVALENYLIDLKEKHLNEFGRIKINLFTLEACKQMLGYVIPYLQHWPTALAILGNRYFPSKKIVEIKF